jgi:hypothetical protein
MSMERRRGATIGGALLGGWMLAALLGASGCGLLEGKKEEAAAKKEIGQECAKDADCASGQCATVGGVCSKGCTYDRECGEGLVCRARDAGGMQCSKPQGIKVGANCSNGSECDHGTCVKRADAPDAPGFCSRTCQGSEDCVDGFKLCATISDNDTTKMCLQGDDKIPIGERPKYTAPTGGTTAPKATTSGTTSTAPTNTTPPAVVDAGAPAADAGTGPKDAGTTTTTPDAGGRPQIQVDAGGRPKIVLPTPTRK